MAVDIRDIGVSPLNASLLPSFSRQLDPRYTAGPHNPRSPTPALPSACRSVASRLLTRSEPGQQPGPPATRPEQLASSKQSLRPVDALDTIAVDGGESCFFSEPIIFAPLPCPYLASPASPSSPSSPASPASPPLPSQPGVNTSTLSSQQ